MSDFRIEGLHTFRAGLNADADMIDDLVADVARGVALRALRGVVLGTPVDTGHARGNWQTSVGRAITGERAVFDKAGGETIMEGASIIATVLPYAAIFLQNNVEYIGSLNDGHSKQAPAGFVEVAIENAVRTLA